MEKSEVQKICEAYEAGYYNGQIFEDTDVCPHTGKEAEAWMFGYQTAAGREIERFGVFPKAGC